MQSEYYSNHTHIGDLLLRFQSRKCHQKQFARHDYQYWYPDKLYFDSVRNVYISTCAHIAICLFLLGSAIWCDHHLRVDINWAHKVKPDSEGFYKLSESDLDIQWVFIPWADTHRYGSGNINYCLLQVCVKYAADYRNYQ